MSASDIAAISALMATMSTAQPVKSASYRAIHTPELLENILLKAMELPVMARSSLRLAHLDENLKLPSWQRSAVCTQMKTLLLSQRVCVAFRRIIKQSVHLQHQLWLLPPVTKPAGIRLNPLLSADKYAYSKDNQIPFTKIVVSSTPQSQTSMHLNYRMWEERPGSWQQMHVTWNGEWQSYIKYTKRDSHTHDMQFTMQFPGCPTAGEVIEKIKAEMRNRCPAEDHADMFD